MISKPERNAKRIRARAKTQDKNLFGRLAAIHSASRKQAQRILERGGGISIVEWRTLWDLYEVGPMTISDLALTQRSDHSLLSRALPDMRRKGLVTMRQAKEDGRQTIVTLTSKGREAYSLAAPLMSQRRAALDNVFSKDEITTLIEYIDRLEQFVSRPASEIQIHDKEEMK